MRNPTKVLINNKEYKINTDFRIAIECDKIARDPEIGEYERALAIIYKLFGDEGLEDSQNHEKLLELGQKYLSMGKDMSNDEKSNTDEPDMDLEQDMDYIKASFMYDYKIDLDKEEMHWYTFFNLLNGLSNSEFGNCCILNRVRNLRNMDTSQIKDPKEKKKIEEAKEMVALKKQAKMLTKEQINNIEEFKKQAGIV